MAWSPVRNVKVSHSINRFFFFGSYGTAGRGAARARWSSISLGQDGRSLEAHLRQLPGPGRLVLQGRRRYVSFTFSPNSSFFKDVESLPPTSAHVWFSVV